MILKTLRLSLTEYDGMVQKGAFDDLNRRVELIRGEVVEMNPAGPLHDDIILYLNNWSLRSCNPLKTLITSQTGIDLPEIDSRPEPDVFWVRKARYRARHPMASDIQLAIEVSDSSLEKYIEIKRLMYAEVGIVEYWIADCKSNVVHIFREPSNGHYQSHVVASIPKQISPLVAPSAILDLLDLFEGV